MPDYYVDAAAGSDANSGAPGTPVRTISRAIQLAAAVPGDTGTILVAPGTYDAAGGEAFPLLVPPGFALQGSGAAATTVRFTGESRTTSDGMVTYWGGTAIHAGAAVRDLALEADPVPLPYTCVMMTGIHAMLDRTELRNLVVRGVDLERSFTWSIRASGALSAIENVRVLAGAGQFVCSGGPVTVAACTFERVWVAIGVGAHVVRDCTFRDARLNLSAESDAEIRDNTFQGAEGVAIIVWWGTTERTPGRPVVRNNQILDAPMGMWCMAGRPLVEGNTFERFYFRGLGVMPGAAPEFRRNVWQNPAHYHSLIEIEARRPDEVYTELGVPIFEENVFQDVPLAGHQSYDVARMRLNGPADLGGGGRSRGLNHFGGMIGRWVAAIEGGGEIFARNNYWRFVLPAGSRLWNFEVAEGTVIHIDGAMVEP